ncbi:HEPN domain-containing protein [Amycolatopsis sp. WGS_07]|uniref:HEPN domain-containing protein n=1 Tax=Amycolatopsis sp. WGS_07 TaxID=3076764 RepID=UPI003872D5FE
MASHARLAFTRNCGDIDRLLAIHTEQAGDGPGRKWQVEALHKSAIVLLTAFWEAFCEDLAAEALQHLVKHADDVVTLPKALRQRVAKELKENKNELALWGLAGNGWRDVLTDRLDRLQETRNRALNTPKTRQINQLFDETVGIEGVSSSWYWPGMSAQRAGAKLDEYIVLRGAVAHRGAAADSIKKSHVTAYYTHVKRLIGRTDSHVATNIERVSGVEPWPDGA